MKEASRHVTSSDSPKHHTKIGSGSPLPMTSPKVHKHFFSEKDQYDTSSHPITSLTVAHLPKTNMATVSPAHHLAIELSKDSANHKHHKRTTKG